MPEPYWLAPPCEGSPRKISELANVLASLFAPLCSSLSQPVWCGPWKMIPLAAYLPRRDLNLMLAVLRTSGRSRAPLPLLLSTVLQTMPPVFLSTMMKRLRKTPSRIPASSAIHSPPRLPPPLLSLDLLFVHYLEHLSRPHTVALAVVVILTQNAHLSGSRQPLRGPALEVASALFDTRLAASRSKTGAAHHAGFHCGLALSTDLKGHAGLRNQALIETSFLSK